MLGSPCSPCCLCSCPSWCGYKMVLSSSKTCPGFYSAFGSFTCLGDAPVSVESPYVCDTSPQTASTSIKGVLSYFGSSSAFLIFTNQPNGLGAVPGGPVIAPDDNWQVSYPSLSGKASGSITGYFNGSGAIDFFRTGFSYEAIVTPFCETVSGQPRVGVQLSYRSASTQARCNFNSSSVLICTVTASRTVTRTKKVYLESACISDPLKWCEGVAATQFLPFPNPLSGWIRYGTTSYGDWDSTTDANTGTAPTIPNDLVLPVVNFEIVSRESCSNPLP